METIFDFEPTDKELKDIFSYDLLTREMMFGFSVLQQDSKRYHELTSKEEKILDLAQLMEYRNETAKARKYWDQIPEIEREYRGGFDFDSERV